MKEESKTSFPACVIDASFLLSAVLDGVVSDELSSARELITDIISQNGQFFVPQLFWFEVGNVLTCASRQKKDSSKPRLSKKQLMDIEYNISQLPISTDLQPSSDIRIRIRDIALEENLTYYDASYLELALRYDLPLYTLDKQLKTAFEKA